MPYILIQIKQLSLNSFILNKDFIVSFILITEIITGKITVILKCLSRFLHEGSEKCILVLNLYRFVFSHFRLICINSSLLGFLTKKLN